MKFSDNILIVTVRILLYTKGKLMNKQLFILSLALGLTSFLQAIDVELINNTNKDLSVRLKSYDGLRRFRPVDKPEADKPTKTSDKIIATVIEVVSDALKASTTDKLIGANFDAALPAHEALLIKRLFPKEELYLGGTVGFFGYSNNIPLKEAKDRITENKIYRVTIGLGPFNTYKYQTSIVDTTKEYSQVAPSDLINLSAPFGYKPGEEFEAIPRHKQSGVIK